MADKILHKRNLTGSILPTTASLDVGELAINVADGKVHLRKSGSNEDVIVSLVTANTVTTGSIQVTNGFTGSLYGTSSWAENAVSASHALTASYYSETDPIFTAVSASYTTTSSFNQFTASYTQDSSSFDSRISSNSSSISLLSSSFTSFSASYNTGSFTGSFTGSLFGTSSWSANTLTASYVNPLRQDVILTGSLFVTQSHISTIDYIDFNTTATPPYLEGRLQWTDDTKTLNIDTDVANFSIEIGHQNVVRARNTYNFNLAKGKIVYINGESGNRPTVATASWEGDPTSAAVIGWVAEQINSNQTGYVLTNGILRGVNTTAFAPGSLLYLSSSGDYTDVKPNFPNHEVRLGQTITQAVDGTIFVNIINGYELNELHDLNIVSASNGDLLLYSGSGWVNTKQLSGSYQLTGSLNVNGSVTASLFGTASYANNSLSASYAATASVLTGGVPSPFPFTGSAIISGSLSVTGSVSATNFTGSLFGTSSWANLAATGAFNSGYIGRDFYYVPVVPDNPVTNGANLLAAYAWAKTNALPSGSALSMSNRFSIYLPPARYEVTASVTLDTDFIDLVGMSGDAEAAVITSRTVSPVTVGSSINAYKLRNLTIENNANDTNIYCIVIPTTINSRRDEEWDNVKFQYGTNAGINSRIHINSRTFQGKYNNINMESLAIGTGTSYPTQMVVMNLFGRLNRAVGESADGTCSGTFTNINITPKFRQDTGSSQHISYELFNCATVSGQFSNITVTPFTPNNSTNSVLNTGRIQIASQCTTISGRFNNVTVTYGPGNVGNLAIELYAFIGTTLSGTFKNMSFLMRSNERSFVFGNATTAGAETLSGHFENINYLSTKGTASNVFFFNASNLEGTFINCSAHVSAYEGIFAGSKSAVQSVLSGTFINCGVIVTGNNTGNSDNLGIFGGNRNNGAAQRGICSGYFKGCYHRITSTTNTSTRIVTFAGSTQGEASGYFEDCEIVVGSAPGEFRPFGGITAQGFSGTMMNCRLQYTWPARVSGQVYRSDFFGTAPTASAISNILTGSIFAYCRAISTGGSASMQGTTSSYYLCAFNVAPTVFNLVTTPYNVIDVNI